MSARPGSAPSKRLDKTLALVPLLFAVPVLGGIAVSVARLVGTSDPDAGFGNTVNADAEALALGVPLFQDPDEGYSGMLYTPLFPVIVSVLYRLAWWDGWSLLVSLAATLALVALVAWVVHRPRGVGQGDRAVALVEAIGIGALAWVLVSCIGLNGMYEARSDQLAWAFGIGGLVALPGAARGSRAAMVLSLVLLTAAFWTKQNAAMAGVTAVAWMLLNAGLSALAWRRALGFAVALLGLNVLAVGALNVLTSGWQAYLNFAVPTRHPLGDLTEPFPENLPRFLRDLFPPLALGLVFAAVPWLALAGSRGRASGAARRWGDAAASVLRGMRAAVATGDLGLLAAPLLVLVAGALAFRLAGDLNLYFLREPTGSAMFARFREDVLSPGATLLALALLALAVGVLLRGARTNRRSAWRAQTLERLRTASRTASSDSQLVSVLVGYLALGVLATVYFRQKIGTDDNLYIGLAWALALLGATGYRRSRRLRSTALTATVTVASLFLAMATINPSPGTESTVRLPSLWPEEGDGPDDQLAVRLPALGLVPLRVWAPVEAGLRTYARSRTVYEGAYGDLNARPGGDLYPAYDNFSGLLAAGRQPGFLVDALLARRFDAVAPFDTAERKEDFSAGGHRWEENYLWKLNRVMRAGYRETTAAPKGLLERRAGPNRAAWMKRCFGPFHMEGQALAINRGGGFWCATPGTQYQLTLVDTAAPYSDVRTTQPVRGMTGELTATLPKRRGRFRMVVRARDEPAWRLEGAPIDHDRGAMELVVRGPGLPATRTNVRVGPTGTVRLLLPRGGQADPPLARTADGAALATLPDMTEGAVIHLGATRSSGARFELRKLRFVR